MATKTPRGRVAARAAAKPVVTLHIVGVVRVDRNEPGHRVRASSDQRRSVDRYICQYQGSDDHEYRKAFETKPGVDPIIPRHTTHKECADLAVQWK